MTPKRRPYSDLPKLFLGSFSISAMTFGGGYVIVPLLSDRFARKLNWIDEESMLDIVAIAQATPGVMAVNCSMLIGWRTLGFPGALVALLATVLPPLIILSILTLVYDAVKSSALIQAIFRGLMVGVSISSGTAIWAMQTLTLKRRRILPPVIMAIAFALHFFFHINVIYLILSALILGAFLTWLELRRAGTP